MFGLRYHVASLAAVFVALAVGLLLGVAVSGKVSDAEESFERDRIRDLEADLEAARSASDAAARRNAASEELLSRAYPALMEGRLEDTTVAMIFLGPASGSLRSDVQRTLADADGGSPARVVALDVPVDGDGLQAELEGNEVLASYASDGADFTELGRDLGRELAEGGDTGLWSALSARLVEERSGSTLVPVDAAVVVTTWLPPEESDGVEEDGAELAATSSLLDGLVRGLSSTGIPVVGVAGGDDAAQAVELYREQGVSSVDDVESLVGRLALAVLLAGGAPGHYGVGEGAEDGIVPPVEPLPDEGG